MLPQTQPGLLAAFADRLDSIVGLIAAGCAPSSQADPFGVRRDAYALLQVRNISEVANGKGFGSARTCEKWQLRDDAATQAIGGGPWLH